MQTATIDDREPPRSENDAMPGMPVRVLLATLLAGAGAIHLVMVPIHDEGSTLDGALFALAGWVQVALAVFVVARPGKVVLQGTVVANLVIVAAWTVSRTVGLPFGAHPGEVEQVATVDLLASAMAVGAVALAALAVARPGLGRSLSNELVALGAIIPVGLLVLTSMVLADGETLEHDHGEVDAASAELASLDDRCDLSFNPASYWRENDLMTTHTAAATPSGDGHDHGGATEAAATFEELHPDPFEGRGSPELDDLVAATTNAEGELGAATVVTKLSEVDDQVYEAWLHQLHTLAGGHDDHGGASPDDNGGHGGHMGAQAWEPITDPAQCDALAAELETAREVALRHPTAADATAAGWVRVTPYVPGIAAHYMNFGYVDGEFHVDEPEMILYDGSGPDARVIGLSYYVLHESEAEPGQGFTGTNDHYHRHVGLCVSGAGVIGDTTTTEEECEARGGRKQNGGVGWMSHAWVVPGCESPWGVFSAANPLLDPALAEVADAGESDGACGASGVRDRYDLSPGDPTNVPTTIGGASEQAAP